MSAFAYSANGIEKWRFSNWSGDIESDENPLNIALTEKTEIYANFVLAGNEYRVDLQMSNENTNSELSFGQLQEATYGFDTNLDLEGPPPLRMEFSMPGLMEQTGIC